MNDIIKNTKENYNKIAKHFSSTRHRLWDELLEFSSMVKDGQNILDWGCGNGRLILLLKDKKIKYFGLDQSVELLKSAKAEYAEEIKKGWVNFFSTASRDKKFPDDFFDMAFLVASFHHLPNENSRLKLLKKIYKEIRVGGKILLVNWNLKGDWTTKKKKMREFAKNDFLVTWKNSLGEEQVELYYHHFEKDELADLLVRAGFVVERNELDNQKRNLITLALKK